MYFDGDTRLREEVYLGGVLVRAKGHIHEGRVSLFLARRYFARNVEAPGNASTLLSVLGIGVGVMTLTVVLAIMNGFQLGFIESIVEIRCVPPSGARFILRIEGSRGRCHTDESAARVPGVTAVVPFVERQALVEGVFQRPRGNCQGGALRYARARPDSRNGCS